MANQSGGFKYVDYEYFESIIPDPGIFYRVRQREGNEYVYLGSIRLDGNAGDSEEATDADIMRLISNYYSGDNPGGGSGEDTPPYYDYDEIEATDEDIQDLINNYYGS